MRANGQAIRAARLRSGRNISDLARAVGIQRPHLSDVELGKRSLANSPATLIRIADVLRVPLSQIASDAPADESDAA